MSVMSHISSHLIFLHHKSRIAKAIRRLVVCEDGKFRIVNMLTKKETIVKFL